MMPRIEWNVLRVVERYRRVRRWRRIREGFPGLLAHMSAALRAGLSLASAFSVAAELLKGPLQEEMRRLLRDVGAGMSLEEALEGFEGRVPIEEVELFVRSVETLRRCGGNLIQTFDLLRETMVARVRLQRRIAMLTAQGEMQALVLLALPWVLVSLLALLSPSYIKPLVEERLGWCLLAAVLALEAVGAWWLRIIVRVRV